MSTLPLITIVRDRVIQRGTRPVPKTGKPATGEAGRILVRSWYGPALERLDDRMRLPLGDYVGVMTRTRESKIRAIRFVETSDAVFAAMGPKCKESFRDGRLYVHGVRDLTAYEQLEGCVGTPDSDILWAALGGWAEGKKFRISIVDGGLAA